ncbi:unknown [Prevotella sp. CAG:924]|nr:unknown [Prevotella sp. CAG:924]
MGLIVVVQTVGADDAEQRGALHLWLRDIRQIDAGGVALVFHIESEVVFLDGRGEIVDILHHQVPVALLRGVAGVLQGFYEEGLAGVGHVGGELTHLIGDAAVGVFIGDAEHLVGLQGRAQGDRAERLVDGIFRRGE